MLGSFTEEFARFLHLYFLKSQNILNVFFISVVFTSSPSPTIELFAREYLPNEQSERKKSRHA